MHFKCLEEPSLEDNIDATYKKKDSHKYNSIMRMKDKSQVL